MTTDQPLIKVQNLKKYFISEYENIDGTSRAAENQLWEGVLYGF